MGFRQQGPQPAEARSRSQGREVDEISGCASQAVRQLCAVTLYAETIEQKRRAILMAIGEPTFRDDGLDLPIGSPEIGYYEPRRKRWFESKAAMTDAALRLANSESGLRNSGYVRQSNGTWLGKYYRATITDDPTIETARMRAMGAKPGYIISFRTREDAGNVAA